MKTRQKEYGKGPRQTGKTALLKEAMDNYLRKNPDATIAVCSKGETRISKPVIGGSHEIVPQKQIEKDNKTAARSRTTDAGVPPLSLSEMARVVRACFQVSDQTGERGNRGDGGQR